MPVQGFLPIQPHLLAYLQWKEGLQKGDYFEVPNQSPHAIVLSGYINLAVELMQDPQWVPTKPLKLERLSARLSFRVKGLEATGFFIVADRIAAQFDAYLHHALMEDILTRVIIGMRVGMNQKLMIDAFLEESGLNYHLNADSVARAQNRLREDRHMPKLKGQLRRQYYQKFA